MSNVQIKKGTVGNHQIAGKFLSAIAPDYVRGILRRTMPGICIGHSNPAYHNSRWNWPEGWWVAVQDGLYLMRESNEFNLYWQLNSNQGE